MRIDGHITDEEAIEIANPTACRLSASTWSRSLGMGIALRRGVRAGAVWVNTPMDGAPELLVGGNRQSGDGRELGRNAAKDYTKERTIPRSLRASARVGRFGGAAREIESEV
jgi:betaine-aldehyde dehydrogenase